MRERMAENLRLVCLTPDVELYWMMYLRAGRCIFASIRPFAPATFSMLVAA